MTDLEKAARMALEAMGLIGADLVCDAAHHKKADRHGIGEPCPIQARWHHAFAALLQALSDSVEQPLCDHSSTRIRKIRNYPPGSHISPHVSVNPKSIKPWVGLTDEEADKIYKDGSTFGEMMRMVEAKLKEKNIK
jgi:hypothetical protein